MAKTRLQEKYLSEAVKGMMDKFNYKNVMEIPKIEKVVIVGNLLARGITIQRDDISIFIDDDTKTLAIE